MTYRYALLLAAGLGAAGLAQAQSHSVANYSNPPGKQADSKSGTQATPGQSATADQQDARHPAKGAKDAAANKGKSGKSGKTAKAAKDAADTSSSGSSGAAGSSGASGGAASKSTSQSATAPVTMDGASKGGAEATMQYEPSQRETGDAEQHAFDNGAVPAGSKAGVKK